MPRASHKPTDSIRKKVQMLVVAGATQEQVASIIGIDAKTLRKHYREELTNSKTEATASVAGKLFKAAMSGNVTAQIFWMKTQGGWRENPIAQIEEVKNTNIFYAPVAQDRDQWEKAAKKRKSNG
jgi:DNA-binding XRE family transcriptional regulator